MYFITKSEEDLFDDIERFADLSIVIQHALCALADVRRRLIALADGQEEEFESLCRGFEKLVAALKGMREQIGKCDPYHFPALTFLEFSQALHFVLRRVRTALPPVYGDDPMEGIAAKLGEVKDCCRPEKHPADLTPEQFHAAVEQAFEGMIHYGCKIAIFVRSVAAERGVARQPTQVDAALCRIEQTVDDTNETAHRLDSRDRRHRQEAGRGGTVALAVQRKCAELWQSCQAHPEWFGDAARGRRVTKQMAYDYLHRRQLLAPVVDTPKAFLRALDSARKHA